MSRILLAVFSARLVSVRFPSQDLGPRSSHLMFLKYRSNYQCYDLSDERDYLFWRSFPKKNVPIIQMRTVYILEIYSDPVETFLLMGKKYFIYYCVHILIFRGRSRTRKYTYIHIDASVRTFWMFNFQAT